MGMNLHGLFKKKEEKEQKTKKSRILVALDL